MPRSVRDAIVSQGLMTVYLRRPAYQRNDYISWIARARLAETRQRRLQQMLDELKRGGVYMKMRWHPRHRK